MKSVFISLAFLVFSFAQSFAQADVWDTQGKFKPSMRLEVTLKNTLDIERIHCPVVLPRKEFPYPDIHEMWITVVDPSLPPSPAPSKEVLAVRGGHQLR